jgi:hypothetical protein
MNRNTGGMLLSGAVVAFAHLALAPQVSAQNAQPVTAATVAPGTATDGARTEI